MLSHDHSHQFQHTGKLSLTQMVRFLMMNTIHPDSNFRFDVNVFFIGVNAHMRMSICVCTI
jgi:hypothetical protein